MSEHKIAMLVQLGHKLAAQTGGVFTIIPWKVAALKVRAGASQWPKLRQ